MIWMILGKPKVADKGTLKRHWQQIHMNIYVHMHTDKKTYAAGLSYAPSSFPISSTHEMHLVIGSREGFKLPKK